MQVSARSRRARRGSAIIVLMAVWTQAAMAPADEIEVEAFAGEPLGVGKITVLHTTGRSQRLSISDSENRVLYPAYDVVTPLNGSDRNLRGAVTAFFLFRNERPLEVTIERWKSVGGSSLGPLSFLLGYPFVDGQARVTFDTPHTARVFPETDRARHAELLKEWWRAHSAMAAQSAVDDAYPPQVENYVSAMLARRLKLAPPKVSRDWSGHAEIDQIFGTLFGAESVRLAMQKDTLLRPSQALEKPDLPFPHPVTPPAVEVPNVPGDVQIEQIARHVPAECFYVRCESFSNFRWLRATLDAWGGNLRDLVAVRGLDYDIRARMERQLALHETALSKALGEAVIADVALIGTDTFFREGASVGLLFQARNSALLSAAIRSQRAEVVKAEQTAPGRTASERTIEIDGHAVSLAESPDNAVRSFYAIDGDFHLVTTSQTIVRRFFEAGAGKDALGGLKEFRYARTLMPVARKDAIFVYLSDPWFRLLVSPQYRVEMTRRMQAEGEIELVHLARLAARAEQQPADTIEQLISGGFLPDTFGRRPDGSRAVVNADTVVDSLRGARRSFLPVPDVEVRGITFGERHAYDEFAKAYRAQWQRLDPVIVGIKRERNSTTKGRLDKIALDVHISPYAREQYDLLAQVLAEPSGKRIAAVAGNVIDAEVRLKRDLIGAHEPELDRAFAGLRDFPIPFEFREGLVVPGGVEFNDLPGYFGHAPAAARSWFLDGGDAPEGYSQSKNDPWGQWHRKFGDLFVTSSQKAVLEAVTPQMKLEDAPRPAQLRLRIGDLAPLQIAGIMNAYGYERARATSAGNVHFMHALRQQLRVPLKMCGQTMQEVLAARPICPLGGKYVTDRGHSWWVSTAWPKEFVVSENRVPEGYRFPPLQWFHGLELEFSIDATTLTIHIELELTPSDAGR